MMELDEGAELLSNQPNHDVELILNNCINNPKDNLGFYLALSLAMANAADAVEIMCVSFIMSEIDNISSLDKEFLSSAVFLGMLFGGLLCGYVADIVGRKTTLLFSLGINSIAGFISAFSPNVNFLIFFRVLGGIGIGGSVPIVFSFGAEVFPESSRGRYLSFIASFWMVGAIFVALVGWIMLGKSFQGAKILPGISWRYFAVVCSFPVVLAFYLVYQWLPESPRFLYNKRRYQECCSILNSLSTVHITITDLEGIVTKDRFLTTSQSSPNPLHNNSYSLIQESEVETPRFPVEASLFMTVFNVLFGKNYCLTTVVLMIIWFTLSFGSYGISTWISVLFKDVGIGNAYAASFIFAFANLPGNMISLWLIDYYGRIRLLTVGMTLAGLSSIGFALDTKNAVVVVLFASLFNAFGVIGWNSLDCLSAESFPTSVRSSAMGFLAASGRLGAIAGQFVNGSLESNIPLLLFVTSACSILGGAVAMLLPRDTLGDLSQIEEKNSSVNEKEFSNDNFSES